jgi:hypothetical protein
MERKKMRQIDEEAEMVRKKMMRWEKEADIESERKR